MFENRSSGFESSISRSLCGLLRPHFFHLPQRIYMVAIYTGSLYTVHKILLCFFKNPIFGGKPSFYEPIKCHPFIWFPVEFSFFPHKYIYFTNIPLFLTNIYMFYKHSSFPHNYIYVLQTFLFSSQIYIFLQTFLFSSQYIYFSQTLTNYF